ncbi:MAG: hypothetical protein JW896_04740 [Deltaproteobacteria bacterium]|nr:hypothetical protein [Deltaproteobacteria bacterium]
MKKKEKNIVDEIIKIKNEMVTERMNEIFRTRPDYDRTELAMLGFEWLDEDYPNEVEEESNAVPENKDQELLVAYFDGEVEFSDKVMQVFLREKWSDKPNYALLRRYFRQGNDHLKALIYHGLAIDPTDDGFLNDLSLIHEFHPMLGELIERYIEACGIQEDLDSFSELAQDFFYNTTLDGYEAYNALKEIYGSDTPKGKVIDSLVYMEEALNGQPYVEH